MTLYLLISLRKVSLKVSLICLSDTDTGIDFMIPILSIWHTAVRVKHLMKVCLTSTKFMTRNYHLVCFKKTLDSLEQNQTDITLSVNDMFMTCFVKSA